MENNFQRNYTKLPSHQRCMGNLTDPHYHIHLVLSNFLIFTLGCSYFSRKENNTNQTLCARQFHMYYFISTQYYYHPHFTDEFCPQPQSSHQQAALPPIQQKSWKSINCYGAALQGAQRAIKRSSQDTHKMCVQRPPKYIAPRQLLGATERIQTQESKRPGIKPMSHCLLL